nr:immunoglobulin light chain junction region [Macaca mulatta]
CQKYSDAPYSF